MTKTVTLELLLVGFGNVSRRFAAMLDERRERLANDHGLSIRIIGAATARRGGVFAPDGLDLERAAAGSGSLGPLANGLELIAAAAASPADVSRVVVETTPLNIVDAQPAIDHVRLALRSRMHVVSANKGPVALAYRELRDLAEATGVRYLFEGAVMDGIPVFNLVRETMPATTIAGFRGVLNSTTNYIITMLEEGGEFAPALAEMQRQGIAEADASLDVDGWDAAAKTAALVNVLMDGALVPAAIDRQGIADLTGETVRGALARGRRIRLISSAHRNGNSIAARVAPEELPADDPLSLLRGMANALYIESDLLGRVGITQLDGGLTQTAYALLSDLVTVGRSLRARP